MTTITQYLTFKIDGQFYALPALAIQEIRRAEPIRPVPRAPQDVAGLLNLRGDIMVVIDVRARWGLPKESSSTETFIVIQHQGKLSACLVDEVSEVVDLTEEAIKEWPQATSSKAIKVQGVFEHDSHHVLLLDVGSVTPE